MGPSIHQHESSKSILSLKSLDCWVKVLQINFIDFFVFQCFSLLTCIKSISPHSTWAIWAGFHPIFSFITNSPDPSNSSTHFLNPLMAPPLVPVTRSDWSIFSGPVSDWLNLAARPSLARPRGPHSHVHYPAIWFDLSEMEGASRD